MRIQIPADFAVTAAVLTCSLAVVGPAAAGGAGSGRPTRAARRRPGAAGSAGGLSRGERRSNGHAPTARAEGDRSDGHRRAPQRRAAEADDERGGRHLDGDDAGRAARRLHVRVQRRRREYAGSAQPVGEAGRGHRPRVTGAGAGRRRAVLGLETSAAWTPADRHLRIEGDQRDAEATSTRRRTTADRTRGTRCSICCTAEAIWIPDGR